MSKNIYTKEQIQAMNDLSERLRDMAYSPGEFKRVREMTAGLSKKKRISLAEHLKKHL